MTGQDAHRGRRPAGGAPQDRIILEGMRFEACHGVYDEEKATPQPFEVDLVLELDLAAAAASDNLADTVDYGTVFAQVAAVVGGPPVNLIERLAGQIAAAVLADDTRIESVTCRVRKPEAPLPGTFGTVGVEISRRRR